MALPSGRVPAWLSRSESLRVVREPCVGGLERDFGSDPELLARQVEGTLRHEVAHHLGL